MAEVEGDCLGFGRQSLPASDEGLLAEEVPCGLLDAAGVGCIMGAVRQLEVFWEVDGGGEEGAADVLCFHGLGD